MVFFPFHIWDVILPIDELHHFSRWSFNHQPAQFFIFQGNLKCGVLPGWAPLRWQWCVFFLPEDQNKTRWRCRFSWQFFRCYPLVNIKKNCGKSWKIRIFDGINYFDWAIFKFANCKRLPGRVIYPTEDVAHIFWPDKKIFPGMNDPTPCSHFITTAFILGYTQCVYIGVYIYIYIYSVD